MNGPNDNLVKIDFPSVVIGPSREFGHFTDEAAFRRFADAYRAAAANLPPAEASTVDTAGGLVRCYRFAGADSDDSTPRMAPLVLLSGRNAATPMWAPALPELLALGRPVYALDALGEAGCSAQTARLETPAQHAAWIADTLSQLGLDGVHLVGHSLGGWMAIQAARHRPELIGSVTVLDPPATFTRLSTRFIAAGLGASVPALPTRWRRHLLDWIAGAPTAESDPLADLGLVALETFRVRQPAPKRPTPAELAGIRVPLLAVLAGRSRVHDATAAADGASVIPDVQVELWPDAHHAASPHRLADLVGDFANRIDLRNSRD